MLGRLQQRYLSFALGIVISVFAGQIHSSVLAPAVAQSRAIELSNPQAILAAFQSGTELASFVPAGLPQSTNPAEGTRGVIRTDDRVPVTSRSYPWSAIGRVEFETDRGMGICSGTLVKPDIVLTNAHCAVDPATQTVYQNIRFAPNLINGTLKDEDDRATVVDLWSGTDFSDRDQPPHPDDWAFLKLDKPLGEQYGTIGWQSFPVSVLIDNPEQFIMVGYSGDFPSDSPGETAGAHEACSILGSVDDNVLRHNCDTTGGSSGGPILAVVDNGYVIVAVNSSGRTEKSSGTGIVNFATKISRIVEQIQAAAR